MPLSQEFIGYATDLITGFGKVDVKRMFGGASLSRNGVGFAILDDDTFFLKADGAFGAELTRRGAKPWVHSLKKDGSVRAVAYWSLPASAADDPEEATDLVKRSYSIAVQTAKAKPRKRPAGKSKAASKASRSSPKPRFRK